jgi:uncharacterized membrane-anchored protein
MTEPTTIRGAQLRLFRALYFAARWALATGLLNISAGFARLARRMAPRPVP